MKNDIRFYESYIQWLPADIYNRFWRWQYMLRKRISRYFKMKIYTLRRCVTEPWLYIEPSYICTEEDTKKDTKE